MNYIIGLLLILFIFLQYQLWISGGNTFELNRFKKKIIAQSKKNEELIIRNRELEADINDLKYNSESIEEIARSRLGMIKKDENYYHFQD
ncbi:MAG: septum formation initiator family protein [Legionellales bacterium]|nr:septum formation initiator family protein [Legionellales bacterium]